MDISVLYKRFILKHGLELGLGDKVIVNPIRFTILGGLVVCETATSSSDLCLSLSICNNVPFPTAEGPQSTSNWGLFESEEGSEAVVLVVASGAPPPPIRPSTRQREPARAWFDRAILVWTSGLERSARLGPPGK
eukprot:CAMPEP_0197530144 /NCGR_PEP_ID=MMETSP1318-20131121/30838_1 /TAXON_ID=552666 /ORGANISM="Partenskyella glossopodia, Strain RCC365" /LENGTH=134 /DNA_ID=CAMNT_0043085853 /DNA_START=243 /DNA_END=648 /DNA_ORIENTATION=-